MICFALNCVADERRNGKKRLRSGTQALMSFILGRIIIVIGDRQADASVNYSRSIDLWSCTAWNVKNVHLNGDFQRFSLIHFLVSLKCHRQNQLARRLFHFHVCFFIAFDVFWALNIRKLIADFFHIFYATHPFLHSNCLSAAILWQWFCFTCKQLRLLMPFYMELSRVFFFSTHWHWNFRSCGKKCCLALNYESN